MLLAALKNKAIDKRADLTEAEEFEVIGREIKQTKETLETAPADRTDIKEQREKRLAACQELASAQMSRGEIRNTIQEVLSSLGIESPSGQNKERSCGSRGPESKAVRMAESLINWWAKY